MCLRGIPAFSNAFKIEHGIEPVLPFPTFLTALKTSFSIVCNLVSKVAFSTIFSENCTKPRNAWPSRDGKYTSSAEIWGLPPRSGRLNRYLSGTRPCRCRLSTWRGYSARRRFWPWARTYHEPPTSRAGLANCAMGRRSGLPAYAGRSGTVWLGRGSSVSHSHRLSKKIVQAHGVLLFVTLWSKLFQLDLQKNSKIGIFSKIPLYGQKGGQMLSDLNSQARFGILSWFWISEAHNCYNFHISIFWPPKVFSKQTLGMCPLKNPKYCKKAYSWLAGHFTSKQIRGANNFEKSVHWGSP